jgi:hypothetical protein
LISPVDSPQNRSAALVRLPRLANLFDRYFLRPQTAHRTSTSVSFMRVAMGLSLGPTAGQGSRVLRSLSSFDFMSRHQPSSSLAPCAPAVVCYLKYIADPIWVAFTTPSRRDALSRLLVGSGQRLDAGSAGHTSRGLNGGSRASYGFKLVNDAAVAVNRAASAKRCGILPGTWHLDIEFLELRKIPVMTASAPLMNVWIPRSVHARVVEKRSTGHALL